MHVHRIVAIANKLADSGRCSRAEQSRLCGVVYRVSAAALSASEPAACTQSRVAQHAQHSFAPDISSSPPDGKMSSMQLPPPLPDPPSIAAEGSTPAQAKSFPSWLAQQVLPAHSQCIPCDPDAIICRTTLSLKQTGCNYVLPMVVGAGSIFGCMESIIRITDCMDCHR